MATGRKHLAATPPMGWMTWNQFQGNISGQLIREIADVMVDGGYLAAGYNYIFIDDCWQGGRDAQNNIIPDPKKFPGGMKALADYVHSKGLKLGIYSDAAQLTCAGYTGSYGFEEQDARTFASWGIDYLKYDYCNAPADSAEAHRRYRLMADALGRSGRDIVLGICEWGGLNPERWAPQAGGSVFRTSGDVRDMWRDITGEGGQGILDIVESTVPRLQYVERGCWPDMDMLVVGLYGNGGPSGDLGGVGCSDTEYRTQMSLWAMMCSPLAMSCDLRSISEVSREILLNAEVIAINQDSLGIPACRKVVEEGLQVFVRPLSGERHALAIVNVSDSGHAVVVDFSRLGLAGRFALRDVWARRDVARRAAGWKGNIEAHATKLFVLEHCK